MDSLSIKATDRLQTGGLAGAVQVVKDVVVRGCAGFLRKYAGSAPASCRPASAFEDSGAHLIAVSTFRDFEDSGAECDAGCNCLAQGAGAKMLALVASTGGGAQAAPGRCDKLVEQWSAREQVGGWWIPAIPGSFAHMMLYQLLVGVQYDWEDRAPQLMGKREAVVDRGGGWMGSWWGRQRKRDTVEEGRDVSGKSWGIDG